MSAPTITNTVDRTDAVRAVVATYKGIARDFAAMRSGHKAHTMSDGYTCLEYTVKAADMLSQWAKLSDMNETARNKALEGAFKCGNSRGFESGNWYGMGVDQYSREIRGETRLLQARLERAQQELAASGLKESLEELSIGARAVRRRAYSDSEGSFDYNRREEDSCFVTVVQRKREFPFIELCYPVGMNCSASNEEISEFNARCLALAEILEGVGYRVAIVAELWSRRTIGSSVNPEKDVPGLTGQNKQTCLVRIPIREANDYGDIQSFAPIACGEFFRRALFCGHYQQVHHAHGLASGLNSQPDSGYGQAMDERPIPAEDGQLVLDLKTVNALFSMDKHRREQMFKSRIAHTIGLRAAS